MARLAVFLLGAPRIELDGEPVHVWRRKAVALLAYLAVEGGAHGRDTLAALLWPEYDQSSARADLRRNLSLLKRKLGSEWLTAHRETAGLNPNADMWLDVKTFVSHLSACEAHRHPSGEVCPDCGPLLEEAVALYGDGFMAGFTLRDSLAFDEWQFFQTERLKDLLASALERLVWWYSERGEYDRAIAHARHRLELDLLNEAAHRGLMDPYARAGQQNAALPQYGLCKATLAEQLGRLPSLETTALFERIRAGEEITREREVEPSVPHNLPPQPTSFVGREAELADLDRLIRDPEVRLITITGPGGIGKTRLALAAAGEFLSETGSVSTGASRQRQQDLRPSSEPFFINGVFFVPLAALGSADQIAPGIADALGFRFKVDERGTRTPKQQVLDYLRDRRLLLILDNFEHLLPPLTSPPMAGKDRGLDSISSILRTAPDVHMLVTSREQLPLHEQQVYPIRGLEYPAWDALTVTADYAAARLFLQAARRVRSSFELGGDDVAFLANICRLLEGTPLGIELAASWVDVLSLSDIAAEIQRGLDFLETDWHDMPRRHRSMRAVIESSWRQLSQAEQQVCARLCVFRGGFTLTSARAVVGADLRTLANLTNKSLLSFRKARGRYEMHELLREYGAGRLAADRYSEAAVHDRHSGYFCAALGRWLDDLTGSRELEALDQIETDLENARAAWKWAAVQGHAGRLYQAMDVLGQFFFERARAAEGDRLFQSAYDGLARVSQPLDAEAQRTLARALLWRSRLTGSRCFTARPRTCCSRAGAT
jgi:DNA-binding SARP family transcriptional activator/predicted ATPase